MMRLAVALIVIAVGVAGCGSDEHEPTRFEDAVASVGDGVSPTGTGVGWVDLEALEPADLDWAALALVPQASQVMDAHAELARTTGFDPAAASQALSVGGSFAFGVRFDDVSPGRLARLLRKAGAKEAGRAAGWSRYDLGSEFEGVTAGPLAPLSSLVARSAVAADGVALARIEYARESLIAAEGGGLLEGGRIESATECLGDVDVARIVPGAFTHNQVSAPATIAFGVEPPADGTRPEVLCAFDLPGSAIADRAGLVRKALAPDAADEVTGQPIAELISDFEVETSDGPEGETVTRVELERPAGSEPGLLLSAFYRGSLLTYLGSPEP